MGFCERLKERREALDITRQELAKLLGVVPSAIANYENGVSHPKVEILYKIFDILDVDANYLYQDEYKKQIEFNSEHLTPHEIEVITAYRGQPDMQTAVDKLLGVVPGEE